LLIGYKPIVTSFVAKFIDVILNLRIETITWYHKKLIRHKNISGIISLDEIAHLLSRCLFYTVLAVFINKIDTV